MRESDESERVVKPYSGKTIISAFYMNENVCMLAS